MGAHHDQHVKDTAAFVSSDNITIPAPHSIDAGLLDSCCGRACYVIFGQLFEFEDILRIASQGGRRIFKDYVQPAFLIFP